MKEKKNHAHTNTKLRKLLLAGSQPSDNMHTKNAFVLISRNISDENLECMRTGKNDIISFAEMMVHCLEE